MIQVSVIRPDDPDYQSFYGLMQGLDTGVVPQ